MQVDSNGSLSGRFTVRRVLDLPDGARDCVAVTCFLVVDGDPPTSLALAFDPHGPENRSDLPPQLKCVAWPTHGWPTGALPAGVDKAAVEAAGAQMVGPNKGDSVVVIHSGRLVYEKYADAVTADTVLPSFSVSKSFTSTMIGLLVDDGKLALDRRAPINDWSAPTDPRRAITLRNILNMSSGLQWNENYSDPQSDVFQMVAAGDESAYVIAKPLDAKPGSRWQYSTGDTAVLGRIIGDTAHVSGDAYQAYLHERLFDPIGINPVVAGLDAAGRWQAGWLTNTTTRNFAKLGLLYLRDGVWENKQFLSSSWVDFVRTPSSRQQRLWRPVLARRRRQLPHGRSLRSDRAHHPRPRPRRRDQQRRKRLPDGRRLPERADAVMRRRTRSSRRHRDRACARHGQRRRGRERPRRRRRPRPDDVDDLQGCNPWHHRSRR